MVDRPFFSYVPNNVGIDLHARLDEARAAAEGALDDERDEASDGWSDEVEEICYGVVLGRVVKVLERPALTSEPSDWDSVLDFAVSARGAEELAKLRRFRDDVREFLEREGCDCEVHPDEIDDDDERCALCRLERTLSPEVLRGA